MLKVQNWEGTVRRQNNMYKWIFYFKSVIHDAKAFMY